MTEKVNMNERISINPDIHFGKPCVAGTRITVQNVLELISENLSFEEIKKIIIQTLKLKMLRLVWIILLG